MFSSNIGFRRRTHSDGSNQFYQRPHSPKRTSVASHRHSLDDSSSTAIKRIVLRKHSGESTGSRGLADRIARSEVENIAGFWSRRISGQKRSVPSSPRQAEFQVNVDEWKKETTTGSADSYSSASEAEKGKGKVKGPRPLPIIPKRTSTTNLIPSLTSSFPETPSSSSPHEALTKTTTATTMVAPPIRSRSPALHEVPVQSQLSPTAPLSLKKTKAIESGTHTEPENAKDAVAPHYPFLDLPPSKPIKITPPKTPTKAKAEIKELTNKKEKEKKRFIQLEQTLSKLLGSYKKGANQSMAVKVFSSSTTKLVPPSTVSVAVSIPPAGIPIPPIPASNALPPIYRAHAHAVQMSRQSAAFRRKSTRKRKTGLARIVMEIAKGKQVAAVEAEALQEATEVREILEQLRQMKAS